MTKEIKVVRHIGNSKLVCIPPKFCNILKIDAGTIFSMEAVENGIMMTIVPVPEEVSKK